MIWTDNFKQVPSGSPIASRKFSGHRWKVWATDDNGYIAFVPTRHLTHGTLGIKKMLDWLVDSNPIELRDLALNLLRDMETLKAELRKVSHG